MAKPSRASVTPATKGNNVSEIYRVIKVSTDVVIYGDMPEKEAREAAVRELYEGDRCLEDHNTEILEEHGLSTPIRLNGDIIKIKQGVLTYEEICELSGYKPEYCPSCVYSNRNGVDGTLTKGQSIAVREGLIINCMYTGNA